MSGFTKKILNIIQSPMNPLRWCLDLECGHEMWVTAKTKPKRKTIECCRCLNQKMPKEPL